MKKFLLSIAAVVSMATSAFAQNPGDDNGFGLKLFLEVPSKGYGMLNNQKDAVVEKPNKVGFGLDLENRWYVCKNNDLFGVALNARWMDLSFSHGKGRLDGAKMMGNAIDDALGELEDLFGGLDMGDLLGSLPDEAKDAMKFNVESDVIDATFLSPGAIFTLYPFKNFAVDVQYNFAPTIQASWIRPEDDNSEDEGGSESVALGFAPGHIFGVAARYKVFSLGVEYKVAKVKNIAAWQNGDKLDDDTLSMLGDNKYNGNRFRVFLGFKF